MMHGKRESVYCVENKATGDKARYAQTKLIKYILLLTGEHADRERCGEEDYRIAFRLELCGADRGLGEEGYEIHTGEQGKEVVLQAETEQGLLYGVYGLLSDHYGVGFYFSGDAVPQEKKPLPLCEIEDRRIPEQYIRGVLPWTNFPQSATSYSFQDWIYMIDQMTRMRMNFINIHNYNGEFGHNEIFHNILVNGKMSRNWNATVSKPHAWGMKGWKVKEYLFGGSEVYDDYDFGADATLHNDCLENEEVFRKGSSKFAFIIRYAHTRGVKIGLGLDLNLVMGDYGQAADDFSVVDARIHQITTDYSGLDYLLLYRSENSPDFRVWNRAFYRTYNALKEKAPNIRIAVSGWGLDPDTVIGLPADVIAAPISGHSVNDRIPDGSIYGEREFWGCPWSERDYNDSIHFAPYRTLLSNTVGDYQRRSRNMKGLMTLTWRVSDGVDAKLSYIAEAPWDKENSLASSRDVYYRYAVKCYGAEAAAAVTEIINENEAYATDASECMYTPLPSGKDRTLDMAKADGQLAVIAQAMEETRDRAWAERLRRLYCRIRAVKAFCRLDQDINQMGAEELTKEFRTFVECFVRRIDDISTAGNLFSVENRYVQEWYLKRMKELGADTGAARTAGEDGEDGGELQVLMISPVTVIREQSRWDIRAAVIGGKRGKRKEVRVCYREAGSGFWKTQALEHRVRGVFGIGIPSEELPEGVVEYYVEAGDGERTGRYPAAAPGQCAVLSRLPGSMTGKPETPVLDTDGDMRLRWKPCSGDFCWYRIYRGTEPGFSVGPQSLVTYVCRDTLSYLDAAEGFDGESLSGEYYYRVSCVDGEFRESAPSNEVCCRMEGIGIQREVHVKGKGSSAASLGKYDFGANASHFYLYYGAEEELEAELYLEEDSSAGERQIGTARLFATGRTEVCEMGDIALTEPLSGAVVLSMRIKASEGAAWIIYGGCSARTALRESGGITEGESFAAGRDSGQPHSGAEHYSVSPFRNFWMLSDIVGCNEDVEIGGLTYGYQYTCRVSEGTQMLYEAEGKGNEPFRIPEHFLTPGHSYAVQVTAKCGLKTWGSVRRDFRVSDENLVLLNKPELLGLQDREGIYTFDDGWGTVINSPYQVRPEGFVLSAGEGDAGGRFTFRLPWKYEPEYPYLLIKAEAFSGDWNIQVNGVPVVGPRENNVAVRKDLRIFGFRPGETLALTLLVNRASGGKGAGTIFRSLQLLPEGSNSRARLQESGQDRRGEWRNEF